MRIYKVIFIAAACLMILGVSSCSSSQELNPKTKQVKVKSAEKPSTDIETFFEKYKGKPHKVGTNGPYSFDCSGFVQRAYKEIFDIYLPRSSESQYMHGARVKRMNDLIYGDLVFFNTDGKGVSHVGIYLYNDQFIHASTTLGVTKSSIKMDYYKKRFIEGRRIIK
jgi:murein DD-endopeptidase / murein LD-carboxypeptidase